MDGITEENIQRLMNEALEALGADGIYSMSLPYIDFETLQNDDSLTQRDMQATLTAAGFLAGIRFTLENLTKAEEAPDSKD